jgi:lipid-binding SYLF domain-containing protein
MEFYSAMKNEILSFASKWTELENITWVRFARHRRPNIVCSPSYVVFRSRAKAVMLLDLGHMLKGRAHMGGMGIGRKPKTWKCLMSPLQRS